MHGGGDDRADAEDLGEGRAGGPDRRRPASSWSRAAGRRCGAGRRGARAASSQAGLPRPRRRLGLRPGSRPPELRVISLRTPPGTSSHSTACSRQATWVRARPRSRCRLAHTFSTAAWSSAPTSAAGGRAQRRDGDRAGVVRVVLVHRSGGQQPHPGGQLGLHVQHPLAGGDQLLGQQVAQAAGALDRPGPLRPGRRPRQQPLRLRRRRPAPAPGPAAPLPRRSPPPCASPCAGRRRSSPPPSPAPSSTLRR